MNLQKPEDMFLQYDIHNNVCHCLISTSRYEPLSPYLMSSCKIFKTILYYYHYAILKVYWSPTFVSAQDPHMCKSGSANYSCIQRLYNYLHYSVYIAIDIM